MSRGQPVDGLLEPWMRLQGLIAKDFSHIAAYVSGKYVDTLKSLSVRRRGPKNYLAVLVRWNEEVGSHQVVFGVGEGFCQALAALAKTIAKDAWKRDKFG